MLVHKRTLGVLSLIWNESGTKLIQATFRNCHEATPDEYWEVNSESSLARQIFLCYPDFIPITNDCGQLIDIKRLAVFDRQATRKKEKVEMKESAEQRGYKRNYKTVNRTGVLDFLSQSLAEAGRMTDCT